MRDENAQRSKVFMINLFLKLDFSTLELLITDFLFVFPLSFFHFRPICARSCRGRRLSSRSGSISRAKPMISMQIKMFSTEVFLSSTPTLSRVFSLTIRQSLSWSSISGVMKDHAHDQATARAEPDGARVLPRRSTRADARDPGFKYTA